MGGMGALEFAAQFPERYDRIVSVCATGQTTPSTQALRYVQRRAVSDDPEYYKTLSERLEELIQKSEEKWDDLVQLLICSYLSCSSHLPALDNTKELFIQSCSSHLQAPST